MYGMIIGAIAGGLAAGISSYMNNTKLAGKYREYAKDIRKAAEQYSGKNADNAMREAGSQAARSLNNLNMGIAASQPNTSNLSTQNALRAINNVQSADSTVQGQNLGRNLKAQDLNNKYNRATNQANLALKQGKMDYNLANATTAGVMQGAQTLADTYKTIGSDERIKEYNNHNNLPKADAEDALRQIESIEYEYKDGLGPQDGKHVGITAQSAEGTAFGDMVQENNGIKELDKNKLLESVMAGIASLQKELDELEGK